MQKAPFKGAFVLYNQKYRVCFCPACKPGRLLDYHIVIFLAVFADVG